MIILGVDTETIPNQSIPEACKPAFDPDNVAWGNLKDPIKKKQRLPEKEKEFNDALDKKMSLAPAFLQLCTFAGIAYDTEKKEVVEKISVQVGTDGDDYEAVYAAWKMISKYHLAKIPLVTFNGIGFDLPALLFRALSLDIPIQPHIYQRLKRRYDNQYHYDLMQILAFWDPNRWHKLDYYGQLFGLGSKGGMDGSQVYPTWKAGNFDIIQKYCEDDTLLTCKLFGRVEHWITVLRDGLAKGERGTEPDKKKDEKPGWEYEGGEADSINGGV